MNDHARLCESGHSEALAQQERVRLFDPPLHLPPFAVKQHWHERFHADVANAWLRRTLAEVLGPRK